MRKSNVSNQAQIDVVIPTAGSWTYLEKCIKSVDECSKDLLVNVVVVTDGVENKEVEEHSHIFNGLENINNLKVKRLVQNVGYGKSCSEGARMFSSPLIMFLNDDVELNDGAIESVVKSFYSPEISVVGIKLIFPKDGSSAYGQAGTVQHVGMSLDMNANPQHPLAGWSANNPKCNISREVWAVTGACMTIRRSVWNKVGGFDKRYEIGYFEDVDLCLSARQLGGKIYMNADAIGQHAVGSSMSKREKPAPIAENAMKFKSKWASSGLLIWDMFTYY